MAHKADAVRIVARQDAILIPKRIGGPNRACTWMLAGGRVKGRLFVGQSNIATRKASGRHAGKKLADLAGTNRVSVIASRDGVLAQPVAVNERGARMRYWPADD